MADINKLHIYRVKEKYVYYLNKVDNRVQHNKGQKRPYIGVVLKINQFNYFVPMESPKPNHANLKNAIHIMKLDGGKLGILGFNNMIPVKDVALIDFDIEQEPDEAYKNLLRKQLHFCNKHKDEILEHAQKTYDAVTAKKSKFHMKICCNFMKLERACSRFVVR